ncbi:hypothetical protein AMATHDRAFT_1276 [Amanita thiersii Skay4041]|uniref:CP-type G domain-containing protein n=1 Tax=Amanita thiersii Skay4041 TaxID=703135 RepID=A0A2A9NZS6_9AGAR|nr:hypothetical protein AMATHDRAFT_1276 [Amanita thiersii Skay4041]
MATLRLSVLLWVSAVHLVGIYLFTRGFLLSRLSLSHHTICNSSECTLRPTHSRAVILIIDSLRFDFITPDPPQPPSPNHHNVLTLPRELTAKRPSHSFLFNAYADPPTTTLQRIKGLTTGSLPTFIDMGNNFGGSSIMEDSILKQVSLTGKTAAFMGDDTWMSVFPDVFHPNMTFPYDSFNVEDLHTVDEGVITHLFPLLNDSSKPFDLLIGHFLGVDHVGHRVGPDHPSMRAKLQQMNDVLSRVVNALDDETLLVVLGDHGMDRSGDHGGDGILETSAALWVYSKGPALKTTTSSPPSGLLQYKIFPGTTQRQRSIQQIDILPTISLLLGLPIPYNNLGSIIPEIFWRTETGDDLRRALELNAAQIRTYLDTYRSSPSGGELDEFWNSIQKAWGAIETLSGHQDTHLVTLNHFNRVALSACRSMWAQFDPILMGFGLAVLCIAMLSIWFVYAALWNAQVAWRPWLQAHMPLCLLGTVVGSILGVGVSLFTSSILPSIKIVDWMLFFASLCSCLSFVITSPPALYLSSLKRVPIIAILHTVAFFSNSFTFWEDRIVPFLLTSSILVQFVPTGFSAPTSRLRLRILGFSALFLLCTRLISVSTVCREEQQPWCHVTFFASSTMPSPPLLVLVFSLPVAAFVLPWSIMRMLAITKSNVGLAKIMVPIVIRPSLVAGTLFWLFEWADSAHVLGGDGEGVLAWAGLLRSSRTWIARFAFTWPLIVGMALWYLVPLCLHMEIIGEGNQSESAKNHGAKSKRQVAVLGYANAFGASYLMFWTVVLCIVYATLQITAQVTMALATVGLLAYLEIVDSVRDVRSMQSVFSSKTPSAILDMSAPGTLSISHSATVISSGSPTQVRFNDIIPIALLGLHTFYATGHQATISSIQWKAAFILTETVKYPWAPFTVGCNMLGPVAVISGLGVTLVALWNKAPGVPSSPGAKAEGDSETKSEELIQGDTILASLGVMMYYGMLLIGAAMSAAILRRHLMVWKVFAPRFMTAAVQLLVVDASVLVGASVGVGRVVEKIGLVFGSRITKAKLTLEDQCVIATSHKSRATLTCSAELKKDPGVPKLPNLKVKLRDAQKPSLSTLPGSLDPDSLMASEPTLSTLASLADESVTEYQTNNPSSFDGQPVKTKEQIRRYYLRTLHKVVDESDIVILVLDARDPEGCRSRLVEEEVRRRESEGKKLVFVLTKIDLIPRSNAEQWLKYLRHTTPTLPFRSPPSSQNQRSNISSTTAPSLMKLLKAYKPKAGSVTIGVVGYPNVGKSSLINCLKRSKVCAVAAQPGHTKEIQSVQLERGLRIIDSPGVVFDDDNFDDGKGPKKGSVLLRNVVKVEDVEDPIAVVEEILQRTPTETIRQLYSLPEFTSTLEFLTMLALNSGRLLKVNPTRSHFTLLIPGKGGYSRCQCSSKACSDGLESPENPVLLRATNCPPFSGAIFKSTGTTTHVAPGAENVGQAQILSEFSKPFTLEGLFGAADAGAFNDRPADVQMDADGDGDAFYDAMEGDAMEEDGRQMISDDLAPHIPRKRSRSPSSTPLPSIPGSSRINSDLDQVRYTRQPKRQRRSKDIPSYEAPVEQHVLQQMSKSNPLNRRALKKEAKRARKAHRVKSAIDSGGLESIIDLFPFGVSLMEWVPKQAFQGEPESVFAELFLTTVSSQRELILLAFRGNTGPAHYVINIMDTLHKTRSGLLVSLRTVSNIVPLRCHSYVLLAASIIARHILVYTTVCLSHFSGGEEAIFVNTDTFGGGCHCFSYCLIGTQIHSAFVDDS